MVAYSFNKRFVGPIRAGLAAPNDPLYSGLPPKRQTIRAIGKRRHARPSETLQLYHGMRTKQCFKIGEAICVDVHDITLWIGSDDVAINIEGKQLIGRHEANLFAQADGFADTRDMAAFWHDEHVGVEKFDGVCIKWRAR